MGRGINKVILIGNVGQDPEVRYMQNGNAVATISLATSDSWKDKQTGEQKERTEWHRVIIFGKLADVAGKYLKKGSQVYFEGRLQTRKWQDQSGQDRYTTEVVIDMTGSMQMLGGKQGNESWGSPSQPGVQNQARPQNGYNEPTHTHSGSYTEKFLPFRSEDDHGAMMPHHAEMAQENYEYHIPTDGRV